MKQIVRKLMHKVELTKPVCMTVLLHNFNKLPSFQWSLADEIEIHQHTDWNNETYWRVEVYRMVEEETPVKEETLSGDIFLKLAIERLERKLTLQNATIAEMEKLLETTLNKNIQH